MAPDDQYDDYSIIIPILSIVAMVIGGCFNIAHLYITFNPSRNKNHSSTSFFKIKLRHHQQSSFKLLFLSHSSMILMVFVLINICLTYFYPQSKNTCITYWKVLTIAYTVGLYFMKWIYEIRAYTVYYTINQNHIICKFIKGLFIYESICFIFVIISMCIWLTGSDLNNYYDYIQKPRPCILKFDLKAAYFPLALMATDATLITLFTVNLLKMTNMNYAPNNNNNNIDNQVNSNISRNRNKNYSEMKVAIVYHYVLTISCVIACGSDYVICVIYMDYYIKLVAVIIDSLLLIVCNFFIVNDQIEKISVKWLHKKFTNNYYSNNVINNDRSSPTAQHNQHRGNIRNDQGHHSAQLMGYTTPSNSGTKTKSH